MTLISINAVFLFAMTDKCYEGNLIISNNAFSLCPILLACLFDVNSLRMQNFDKIGVH